MDTRPEPSSPPAPMPPRDDGEVSLGEYLDALWRRRYVLVIVGVAAALVAFAVNSQRAPVYEARSRLLVSPSKIGDGLPTVSIGTFLTLVGSQSLVAQTVQDLGLSQPPHNLSATDLVRHVRIDPVPDALVIVVSVRLPDAQLAAAVANGLAERAVDASRKSSQDDIVSARDTIKLQLDESRGHLEQMEQELRQQRIDKPVETLEADVEGLVEQRARLLPLGIEIEAERVRVEQLTRELSRQDPVRSYQRSVASGESSPRLRDDLRDPYANPVHEALAQELATSRVNLAALEREHAEISRLTSPEAAARKVNELAARRQALARRQTELDLARQAYEAVSTRYEQARLQVAARSTQLQIIDRAVPPAAPSSPNVVRNTVAAAGLAVVLAGAFVLLLVVMGRDPGRAGH